MKKYMILAAVAALTLAACAKVETSVVDVDGDVPVGFSTYSPKSLSKAGATYTNTNALPTGSSIGVYGYSTESDAHFLGTENPAFITNGEVAFSAASSSPTGATDKRYWPKDLKNLLTFYAYYPYNNAAVVGKPLATATGLGAFNVTQTGDVTTMVDFMISDVENDMYFWDGTNASTNGYGRKSTITGTTKGIVPLSLHHMMSNVNFYFKTNITDDDITITVKEASIAGVLSQGVFTPSYTVPTVAGERGETTFGTAAVTESAYASAVVIPIRSVVNDADVNSITLNTTAKINYADVAETTAKNNFLFVPQTLTTTVKVTIKYDLTQGGSTTTNTVVVPIMGDTNDENNPIVKWEYNRKYNYIFTIGLQEILFTGAATNWTDGATGSLTAM